MSGVVGPSLTSWANRRGATQGFQREVRRSQRDDIRQLLDEAAVLLAQGPTMVRRLQEAVASAGEQPAKASEWRAEVFPLGERLRLRLPVDHPIVTSYEVVRTSLADALEAASTDRANAAVDRFENLRDAFLQEGRHLLDQPIPNRS
jgi:hypothetical protein